MISVAVIEQNSCVFDKIVDYLPALLYQSPTKEAKQAVKTFIKDIIDPYISLHTINEEDLIQFSCQTLSKSYPDAKLDKDLFFHTEHSFAFPKAYMEIIHCNTIANTDVDDKRINNIGCLLSLKHTVIEGKCIVIANNYSLQALRSIVLGHIDINMIIKMIQRRYFQSSILITPSGECQKYYYQDPRYLISKLFNISEAGFIQKMSFTSFKYNLVMCFIHKQSEINPLATRINGNYRLHGNVLVIHELDDKIFGSIGVKEISNLGKVSFGRLFDRQLRGKEIHTDQGDGKVTTPYWSKHVVMMNRMKDDRLWKCCINCSDVVKDPGVRLSASVPSTDWRRALADEQPVMCDRCHRAIYCSLQCQIEYRGHHYDDCINELSSVPK